MIAVVQTIPAGNALRVWMQPPSAAKRIRLLRKESDNFTGWDDPDALVVSDGLERIVTDFGGLIDGSPVCYRAYYHDGSVWDHSPTKAGIPETSFTAQIVDPLSIVRDRLELGLRSYVLNGVLQHARNYIPVMTASPQVEDTPFPVVTVHLQNDSSEIRALGEEVATEYLSPLDGLWHSFEGTLGQINLMIVGWAMNADERRELRNAIKAVIIANLPIFEAAGLLQVNYAFSDLDDFETYEVPMYSAVCTLTCFAFSAVESTTAGISDVVVSTNND